MFIRYFYPILIIYNFIFQQFKYFSSDYFVIVRYMLHCKTNVLIMHCNKNVKSILLTEDKMMESVQQNMNEQMKKFADLQAKSLEPMRIFGALAADASEQLMRQNYAVMGDYVDFAVKQAHTPLNVDAIGETASTQIADVTAFGELLGARASEYVELANGLAHKTQKAAEEFAAKNKAV